MNIKSILFAIILLGFSSLSSGKVLESIIVTGVIKKTEANIVYVRDALGQTHKVSQELLTGKIRSKKLFIGDQVSFEKKIVITRPYPALELKKNIKLSKEEKEHLVRVMWRFLSLVEDKNKKLDPNFKPGEGENLKKTTYNLKSVFDFFFSEVHALPPSNACVYAGYTSVMTGTPRTCRPPWSGDNPEYQPCGGGDNVFRCNPKIFGRGLTRGSGDPTGFAEENAVSAWADEGGSSSYNLTTGPGPEGTADSNTTDARRRSAAYVFKTSSSSAAHGFCVLRTDAGDGSLSNITRNCVMAAERNMASILRNFDNNYFNNTYLPLIHAQCANTNLCPAHMFKSTNNTCVSDCASGLFAGTDRVCRTTAAEASTGQATNASESSVRRAGDGFSAECAYLAKHIESINFHHPDNERTQCALWENSELGPPVANCRSVKMSCQRGGHIFTGYLSQAQFNNATLRGRNPEDGSFTAIKDISGINIDRTLEFNFPKDFKLNTSPCLNATEERRQANLANPSLDNCLGAGHEYAQSLGETNTVDGTTRSRFGGGANCQGDYCVVNNRCRVTPANEAVGIDEQFTYDVTLVCRCSPNEYGRDSTIPINLAACQRDQIPQYTPSRRGEIYLDNNASGALDN